MYTYKLKATQGTMIFRSGTFYGHKALMKMVQKSISRAEKHGADFLAEMGKKDLYLLRVIPVSN